MVVLLDRVLGAGIFRVDRLASGKAFVLAVIEADAVFSQPPAQIDLFILKDGRKIHQARVEVFHHAAGGLNSIERVLDLR